MTLNFAHQKALIGSCNSIQRPINTKKRPTPHIKRTVQAKRAFIISPGLSEVSVTYNGVLSDDRYFLFEPGIRVGSDGGVYVYLSREHD